MDELDLLTRLRPDPAPPTDAERAAIRTALLTRVGGATTPPRHRIRPGRTPRLLLAAVAAAIVVVALVVATATDDDGESAPATAPSSAPPTSPVDGGGGPFPTPPFRVEVRVQGSAVGGSAPREISGTVVVHQLDDGLAVMDVTRCMECDPTLLALRFNDALTGPIADVSAAVDGFLAEATDATGRLALIEDALGDRRVGLEIRRALVEELAATEGLAVDERWTTAHGDIGTRYLLADDGYGGSHALVVDPIDGYVLEQTGVTGPEAPTDGALSIHTPAGAFATDGVIETTVSFRRPEPEDAVPAEIAELAATVRVEDRTEVGSCAAAAGNEDLDGAVLEIPLPRHLAYAYCPER